jgi:hypothetical protein
MTQVIVGTDVSIGINIEAGGIRTDPTVLELHLETPGGSVVHYVYGVNPELHRLGIGQYAAIVNLASLGDYAYVWTVSGNVSGTSSGVVTAINPPQSIVINVQNNVDMTTVPDARVEVKTNDELLGAGTTDSMGAFSLPLRAGRYAVYVFKKGWSFTPVQIDVLGLQPPDTESFTVGGTDLDIGVAIATTCRVFGFVLGLPNARVLVHTLKGSAPGGPANTFNNISMKNYTQSIVPNKMGYWEVDVVVGSTVAVEIPAAKTKKTFIVPHKQMIDYADVVSALTEKSP